MSVTLVAAMGSNRVIGRDGDIPWRLPEDQRRFKELTWGGTLVMGRRTYDSIGRPLPGRRTVVVTRQAGWSADGVQVAHSLPEALEMASVSGPVFVVGGEQVYAEALDRADVVELTEIDQAPDGDTYFPPLPDGQWRERARDQRDGFAFVTYERLRP